MDWQPIETAPKDGSLVILTNGVHVSSGHWVDENSSVIEVRDMDGRYVHQVESDQEAQWMDWHGGMLPSSTHWMPLPEPPSDR